MVKVAVPVAFDLVGSGLSDLPLSVALYLLDAASAGTATAAQIARTIARSLRMGGTSRGWGALSPTLSQPGSFPDQRRSTSIRPDYTGTTPWRFHGRSMRLPSAISSARMIVGRVSRGS